MAKTLCKINMYTIYAIITSTISSIVFGVIFFVVAATYGGNYMTQFTYGPLRGYEATGIIGSLVGFALGATLGLYAIHRLMERRWSSKNGMTALIVGFVTCMVYAELFLATGILDLLFVLSINILLAYYMQNKR
jgi:hypothetical protein